MNKEDQVIEICALLQAGEATVKDLSELKKILSEDPSLVSVFNRENEMHALLSVSLEDELTTERKVLSVQNKLNEMDSDQFVSGVTHRLTKQRWWRRISAVAVAVAVILISLVGGFNIFEPSLVATIEQSNGVKWSEGAIKNGAGIKPGSSIAIDKGMLELDLAGRGRLIVEGPAHLEFANADHSILHHGSVVMRATEKGKGYRIETQQGSIIDVGTEFGVTVKANGLVETHVIEGSVEAIPNDSDPVILVGNDGMRMGPEGNKLITADSSQYYTLMPPQHVKNPRYIHWGFNEASGDFASSEGELSAELGSKAKMSLYGEKSDLSTMWVEGASAHTGSALSFDGLSQYAESEYRGIDGGNPRTVCFWVKVPEDFSQEQGFGILSWGKRSGPGAVWQLSVNPLKSDGLVGRLRLGLIGGQIVGSTDLRDGKWHHISVVMYGGSMPNVGTHVILYVDGEQEQVSRKALQEVKTETDNAEHGVWLGRNSGFKEGNEHSSKYRFFRGELDELYIFDAALSQDELLKIMKSHQ